MKQFIIIAFMILTSCSKDDVNEIEELTTSDRGQDRVSTQVKSVTAPNPLSVFTVVKFFRNNQGTWNTKYALVNYGTSQQESVSVSAYLTIYGGGNLEVRQESEIIHKLRLERDDYTLIVTNVDTSTLIHLQYTTDDGVIHIINRVGETLETYEKYSDGEVIKRVYNKNN